MTVATLTALIVAALTAFLTGAFGLAIAAMSVRLTQKKENEQHQREKRKARYEKVEVLYIDTLALLEKTIRYTESDKSYNDLQDDLSRLNARLQLSAPKNVMSQYEKVGSLIHHWSGEYRMGEPRKLGDGVVVYTPILNDEHKDKAEELYPRVETEMVELVASMKEHLTTLA